MIRRQCCAFNDHTYGIVSDSISCHTPSCSPSLRAPHRMLAECCIYHKPRAFDESDSDVSDGAYFSSDDEDAGEAKGEGKAGGGASAS